MTELEKEVYMLGAMEKLIEENKKLKKEVKELRKYKTVFNLIKRYTYFPYPYECSYYFTFSAIALERDEYEKVYNLAKKKTQKKIATKK